MLVELFIGNLIVSPGVFCHPIERLTITAPSVL